MQDHRSPSPPHDFRRLFAAELVGTGLPLHIVSTLLGHLNLETTRGYTAVFPEHVTQAHDAFIERRRQTRPDDVFRGASDEEWGNSNSISSFDGSPWAHATAPMPPAREHACINCRFLQVDPAQVGRIETMTENAEQRLAEAREHQWLGKSAPSTKASCTSDADSRRPRSW